MEILIPGDELERLSRLLAAVHDTVGDLGDLDLLLDGHPARSIGDVRLARAVNEFHSRSQRGQLRLRAETAQLSVHAAEIVEVVRDTDRELGARVTAAPVST